jgi:Zn-finger nucleic acid-binding protein
VTPESLRNMKCPTCKSPRLEPRDIEASLNSHSCPQCSGSFIVFEHYLQWQESSPSIAQGASPPLPQTEDPGPRLCPYCGRFMTRFRIALDLPFQLDRCGGCAGMWLESGEWAILRARGMLTRLNAIFADSYQLQLRQEEARRQQEDRYRTLLGEETFQRVQEFKRWSKPHAKRSVIMAFLEDKEVK